MTITFKMEGIEQSRSNQPTRVVLHCDLYGLL